MPAIDEDDRPKKKIAHEIGQDLTLLSVNELTERIALLNEEIARLDQERMKKQATRSAADQFSRSSGALPHGIWLRAWIAALFVNRIASITGLILTLN